MNAPTVSTMPSSGTLPPALITIARQTLTADDFDVLPVEMRNARRWLLWRKMPDSSKKGWRKVPYYANGNKRSGGLDSPDDMANFATFEDALSKLQTGCYTGLGFALGPDGTGNCWQGIDLDDMPNRPEIALLSDELPGYTESSPSGNGMHAIGYGRPFATLGSNKSDIEAYAGGRFFTVTADQAGIHAPVCLADFVENRLAPLHRRTDDAPTVVGESDLVETVSPQTVTELRSGLTSMRSDDRDLWVKMGHALKTLGNVGRGLWFEWSQTSEVYEPIEASRSWDSFKPTKTGYKAVFAEAQRGGWVNPLSNAANGLVAASPVGGQGNVLSGASNVATATQIPRPAFAFRQAKDLLSQPKPIAWLIREIFEQGSLAQLFGASGSGKSFLAIDWGCCIATGTEWSGREVEQGAVFYIAGEGHAGIGRRLKAWALHNSTPLDNAPLFVSVAPAALMDKTSAEDVAQTVEELAAIHGKPSLIIVDTLARNLGNGEENSNADIGLFINNIDSQLRSRFGATVLIVHHTGHMEAGRARGASALRAAMDSEYWLGVDEKSHIHTLKCTKAKETEPPEEIAFKLKQIVLDDIKNDDGEPMTSAVLIPTDEMIKQKRQRLTGANGIAYKALTDALAADGQPPGPEILKELGELRAPNRVVHLEVWRKRAYDSGISDKEQAAKQKAFRRARTTLLEMDLVNVWQDFYWRGTGTPGHQTLSGQCPDLSPT